MRRSRPGNSWRKGWLILATIALLLAGGLGYLLLTPSPIRAVGWLPAARPDVAGPLAQNGLLLKADLIGLFQGPYDVAVDHTGQLYTGTAQGTIQRVVVAERRTVQIFARTGGRPLGLDFDRVGNLIVADGKRGLLSVNPAGRVRVLTASVAGQPIRYAHHPAVAPDGRIYFSDASDRGFGSEFFTELLEARPHGRLLVYDPATGKTSVLIENLYFAGGVALPPGGAYVLVSQTARYRISRYWLKGPRAGVQDTFAENLPGFVGGLAFDNTGNLWATIIDPRLDLIDRVSPNPDLKNLLAKLPAALLKGNEKGYGLVLEMDSTGRILRSLHDPTGRVHKLTGVKLDDKFLYFGTLDESGIGRLGSVVQSPPSSLPKK